MNEAQESEKELKMKAAETTFDQFLSKHGKSFMKAQLTWNQLFELAL